MSEELKTMSEELKVRMSLCVYRHPKVVDGYGYAFNGRQTLRGNYLAEAPSSPDLPFFESKPDKPHDSHYCGCHGWD